LSQNFFVKLIPPRTTFSQDMTADERRVMQQHVEYWTDLMDKKFAIVFGPVMDPVGVYGIGVIQAENEDQLRTLIDGDPAKTINRYEYWPMRAVHPGLKADS
jgi:uncharacterized protein YciI